MPGLTSGLAQGAKNIPTHQCVTTQELAFKIKQFQDALGVGPGGNLSLVLVDENNNFIGPAPNAAEFIVRAVVKGDVAAVDDIFEFNWTEDKVGTTNFNGTTDYEAQNIYGNTLQNLQVVYLRSIDLATWYLVNQGQSVADLNMVYAQVIGSVSKGTPFFEFYNAQAVFGPLPPANAGWAKNIPPDIYTNDEWVLLQRTEEIHAPSGSPLWVVVEAEEGVGTGGSGNAIKICEGNISGDEQDNVNVTIVSNNDHQLTQTTSVVARNPLKLPLKDGIRVLVDDAKSFGWTIIASELLGPLIVQGTISTQPAVNHGGFDIEITSIVYPTEVPATGTISDVRNDFNRYAELDFRCLAIWDTELEYWKAVQIEDIIRPTSDKWVRWLDSDADPPVEEWKQVKLTPQVTELISFSIVGDNLEIKYKEGEYWSIEETAPVEKTLTVSATECPPEEP